MKRYTHGFALITSMVLIVVLAIVSAMMFRTSGASGKIAGNTLEHQRAFESAESGLRFGEWLLRRVPMPTQIPVCNTVIDLAIAGATAVMCTNALVNPAEPPWAAGMRFTPDGMTIQQGGGLVAQSSNRTGRDVFYAERPMVYIQSLGPGPDGINLYQITSAGFGGHASTVSVLVSVVSVR